MNKLFVYIEGNHDQIFMNFILSEYLRKNKSMEIWPIKYAEKPPRIINKDIKSKSKYNYIFLSDLDYEKYPCISSRKEKNLEKFNHLDLEKIIIVKEEIESWYLAGVDTSLEQFKSFKVPDNTDNIEKEDFNQMIEDKFDSKDDCLIEIAKNFNIDLAKSRNKSFKYFLNKLDTLLSKN